MHLQKQTPGPQSKYVQIKHSQRDMKTEVPPVVQMESSKGVFIKKSLYIFEQQLLLNASSLQFLSLCF